MTQKELLYLEDAVGHEESIIKICEFMIDNLEDEELISFTEKQLDCHNKRKEKILTLMEDNANE